MGGLADGLIVALGGGGTLTVLARSLSVWLKQRRADVKIEVRGPDGRSVIVSTNRVSDPEAVIMSVLEASKPNKDATEV
jgi:hypothetical protein